MEDKKKIRAFKCKTCYDWNHFDKKCDSIIPIKEEPLLDSFGEPICTSHRNKQSGNFTGGFKELKKREKVWFTSDIHFGHKSTLYFFPKRRETCGITLEELQNTPEVAVKKMDDYLIKLWNTTVGKKDTVYYLGDFCLQNKEYTERILRQLHGKKFLIIGNHDKSLHGLENYFEDVAQIKEAKFTNNQFPFIDQNETFCIEMCHYPLLSWNRRNNGSTHIHGHSHGNTDDINDKMKELRVDIGIDCPKWNYQFVELEQLYNYFIGIRNTLGATTFKDYTEKLIKEHNGIKG